jgi:metal-responsive CopG/Arc/MetJ family transcriptional regulator
MTSVSKPTVRSFGCSLPEPLLEQVDALRGDVNRSRYIQRVIEKNMNAIVQTNPQVSRPERSVLPSTRGQGGNPKPHG